MEHRGYKGTLLNVIMQMAIEENIPKLLEIVKDKYHGRCRILLFNRISKSKNEHAKRELVIMKDVAGFELENARFQKKGR